MFYCSRTLGLHIRKTATPLIMAKKQIAVFFYIRLHVINIWLTEDRCDLVRLIFIVFSDQRNKEDLVSCTKRRFVLSTWWKEVILPVQDVSLGCYIFTDCFPLREGNLCSDVDKTLKIYDLGVVTRFVKHAVINVQDV